MVSKTGGTQSQRIVQYTTQKNSFKFVRPCVQGVLVPVMLPVKNNDLLVVGLHQGPWTNVLSPLPAYLHITWNLDEILVLKGTPRKKLSLLCARPGGMGEAVKMGLMPCGLDQLTSVIWLSGSPPIPPSPPSGWEGLVWVVTTKCTQS